MLDPDLDPYQMNTDPKPKPWKKQMDWKAGGSRVRQAMGTALLRRRWALFYRIQGSKLCKEILLKTGKSRWAVWKNVYDSLTTYYATRQHTLVTNFFRFPSIDKATSCRFTALLAGLGQGRGETWLLQKTAEESHGIVHGKQTIDS